MIGSFQVAFQLRDLGTSNIFDTNGGVAVLVLGSAPRILSTTIDSSIESGRYQLVVGKRYLVRVKVAAGLISNTFSVEQNELIPAPKWANVHNDSSPLWRLDPRTLQKNSSSLLPQLKLIFV